MNQATDERRENVRVTLDIPYFITMTLLAGEAYRVMLSNISLDGMQLDLPRGIGAEEIPGNSPVVVTGFPDGLTCMNGLHGRVAWVTTGHCGMRFDERICITPDELYEMLDNI